MTKTLRTLLLAVALPYIGGCFATVPAPIPFSMDAREGMSVRGVVVDGAPDGAQDDGEGQHIEFRDIQDVTWTEDAISIVGIQRDGDGSGQLAARRFDLSALSAVLVREVDPGRTSAVIGGVIVGTAAILTILITGTGENRVPTGS